MSEHPLSHIIQDEKYMDVCGLMVQHPRESFQPVTLPIDEFWEYVAAYGYELPNHPRRACWGIRSKRVENEIHCYLTQCGFVCKGKQFRK